MYLLNIKIKEPRKLIGFSLSHEIIFLESGEGKTLKKKDPLKLLHVLIIKYLLNIKIKQQSTREEALRAT